MATAGTPHPGTHTGACGHWPSVAPSKPGWRWKGDPGCLAVPPAAPRGPGACAGHWDPPMRQWVPLIQGKVGCPCQVRMRENQLEDSSKPELRDVESAAASGTSPRGGTRWAGGGRGLAVPGHPRPRAASGTRRSGEGRRGEGGGVRRYLQFPPTPEGFSPPSPGGSSSKLAFRLPPRAI